MSSTAPVTQKHPVLEIDPYLEPFVGDIKRREEVAQEWLQKLKETEGGLLKFSQGYLYFGINTDPQTNEIVYREWLPNAEKAWLMGDFNSWERHEHELKRINDFGVFELRLKPFTIPHNTKIKLVVLTRGNTTFERVPAWSTYVRQDPKVSPLFDAVYWNPPNPYLFKYPRPSSSWVHGGAKVYEAHVGISTPEGRIGTYNEFTDNVLPLVADLGYNCIQLMAVMEHAYYASFGYQVTNFFAPSSRYGTPEDLKRLIDTAHKLKITVLLDVVHSHASSNSADGLNMVDGSDYQYFHGGDRGNHSQWGSRLFNYGKHEVLRFLLSNLRYWLDEFRFDGFRFDGVTSMLYLHHGIGTGFSGSYHEYFGKSGQVDEEAVNYLVLANTLIKTLNNNYLTIAEDVSGMPTLCLPTSIGGIGFDYRLAMAIPDMWIKLLKEVPDEDWDMGHIAYQLSNRRHSELTIAYAESHDQALVGDKTLAFWLMDKEMYTGMSVLSPRSIVIDRGLALHKMIRLVTEGLGGEGYLNFEGNEFGHPEWLDFPREGNGESYSYARRQFNLIQDHLLLYQYLYNFDKAIQHTEAKYSWLKSPPGYVSLKNNSDKMLVFDRAGLIFVFNFHPTASYTDYKIGAPASGKYRIVLSSDDEEFRGHSRTSSTSEHFTTDSEWNGRPCSIMVYAPSRTAAVYAKVH